MDLARTFFFFGGKKCELCRRLSFGLLLFVADKFIVKIATGMTGDGTNQHKTNREENEPLHTHIVSCCILVADAFTKSIFAGRGCCDGYKTPACIRDRLKSLQFKDVSFILFAPCTAL